MFRRSMLLGCTVLAGCEALGITKSQDLVEAGKDASIVAVGLQGALVELGKLNIIDASTIATIGTAITSIQRSADAIASTASQSDAQLSAQDIGRYVLLIANVLAPIVGIPAPIMLAVQAAIALVPIIEQLVGLFLPKAAVPPTMTPEQARAVLIGMSANVPR
jgi:hypothetical protein